MGDWRCIASNPVSGVSTWIKEEADGVLVQNRQDISALLDQNKAEANIAQKGWKGDGLHSVARLPISMIHDRKSYIGQAIAESDSKAVSRFLNNSDNRSFRTKEGNI